MLGSILARLDRNAEALQLLERAVALAAGPSLLSRLRAAEPARRWCYGAEVRGVDGTSEADFEAYRDREFWVFCDALEHLGDPWHVLARIRRVVPAGGHIGASLPNAQHGSVPTWLLVDDFLYPDAVCWIAPTSVGSRATLFHRPGRQPEASLTPAECVKSPTKSFNESAAHHVQE